MRHPHFAHLALAAAAVACFGTVHAQTPLQIGFITTLSTPAGYIGEDERDGFQLAVTEGGGKLGGVPVKLIVEDDGLKPGNAKQSADKMLQDGVRLFTGINFSNVLMAVVPGVLAGGATYVSLNAGPSTFAGKGCNAGYFNDAFQNDSFSDTAGIAANELGYKKVVILAPNYQAGRDALAGFKSTFKGQVLAEMYTKLDQSDFSVELARIRSLAPDAVFQFHPGGAGINLAKQYANAGLAATIPMVTPIYSMDRRMLSAVGDAGKGYYVTALWSTDLDNAANKQFVQAFEKTYKRVPTDYAAQAYDTAHLIGSALKATGGDVTDKVGAFRAALRKADFVSVRGKFRFGANQHPVQDWYLLRVEAGADGKLGYKMIKTIAKDHADPYVAECHL
jgi:branched-chain amino acid transport system substrate-binding protein